MNELPENANLKEITAYKKKLNWGETPSIYHMASASISEIEGVLVHGFDNAFKHILNRNMWNLTLLQGFKDERGNIQVKQKPQIKLQHIYTEQHYELHCLPVVNGEEIRTPLSESPDCPFEHWHPESMQMLFRAMNLVTFMKFTFQSGDKADLALINYAHIVIENHIKHLMESFDIIEIKGRNLATFCGQLFKHSVKFSEEDFAIMSPSTLTLPNNPTE